MIKVATATRTMAMITAMIITMGMIMITTIMVAVVGMIIPTSITTKCSI